MWRQLNHRQCSVAVRSGSSWMCRGLMWRHPSTVTAVAVCVVPLQFVAAKLLSLIHCPLARVSSLAHDISRLQSATTCALCLQEDIHETSAPNGWQPYFVFERSTVCTWAYIDWVSSVFWHMSREIFKLATWLKRSDLLTAELMEFKCRRVYPEDVVSYEFTAVSELQIQKS